MGRIICVIRVHRSARFAHAHVRHPRVAIDIGQIRAPDSTVLVTAFSDLKKDPKNSDKDEPMVWVTTHGKGRVVENVLGHDIDAMKKSKGFDILLTRCVEWAATGDCRTAVPDSLKK